MSDNLRDSSFVNDMIYSIMCWGDMCYIFSERVTKMTLNDDGLSTSNIYRVYWFSIYSGHFRYIKRISMSLTIMIEYEGRGD